MVTLFARSLALFSSLSLSLSLPIKDSHQSQTLEYLCKRDRVGVCNRDRIHNYQWTSMAYLHKTYLESMTFLTSPTKTSSPPLLPLPPRLRPPPLSLLRTLTTTIISLPPPIILSSTTSAFPYALSNDPILKMILDFLDFFGFWYIFFSCVEWWRSSPGVALTNRRRLLCWFSGEPTRRNYDVRENWNLVYGETKKQKIKTSSCFGRNMGTDVGTRPEYSCHREVQA